MKRKTGTCRSRCLARARKVLLALVLLLNVAAACADDICVNTTVGFEQALVVAASDAAANKTTVIRIAQGTYDLSAVSTLRYDATYFHTMQWLGGYDAICSVRTLAPANTVLDAKGVGLEWQHATGDLSVEGLTFKNVGGDHALQFVTEAPNIELDFYDNSLQGAKFYLVADDYDVSATAATASTSTAPASTTTTPPPEPQTFPIAD